MLLIVKRKEKSAFQYCLYKVITAVYSYTSSTHSTHS